MKTSFVSLPTPPPPLPHTPPTLPPPSWDTKKSLDWSKAISAVTQVSSRYGTALSHARLVEFCPPKACLAFPPQANFHKSSVFGSGRSTVEKALSEFFGSPIQLVEDNREHAYNLAKPSLAEQQATLRESHARKMEAKVHANPHIQSALSILEGHIDSIRTLEVSAPTPVASFEDAGENND